MTYTGYCIATCILQTIGILKMLHVYMYMYSNDPIQKSQTIHINCNMYSIMVSLKNHYVGSLRMCLKTRNCNLYIMHTKWCTGYILRGQNLTQNVIFIQNGYYLRDYQYELYLICEAVPANPSILFVHSSLFLQTVLEDGLPLHYLQEEEQDVLLSK